MRFPSLRTSVRIVHHLISDFVKCDVIFGGRAGLVPSPLLWPEGEVQLLAGHSLSTFVLECLRKRAPYPHLISKGTGSEGYSNLPH